MPYSMNDPKLPSNVKKLPAKQKRQWVHIWNSTYQRCTDKGGDPKACETLAFKSANGVIKKEEGRMTIMSRIKAVLRPKEERATKGWVGSASSYGSTEAYCAACAIDVNTGTPKKQDHCMLPYKKGGKAVEAGVEAAAARFNQTVKPDDVSASKWASAKRAAARKLAAAYRGFGKEPPESLVSARTIQLSTRSTIQRVNGKTRLFSISAVAAKNRVGEIDSRSLFDSMTSIARATGRYPQRDFMHLGMSHPAFVVGDVVFMARDGNCLVTVTEYNDSELAQAEIKARSSDDRKWGDSIAYVLLDEPEVLREGEEESTLVLNFGFCKYISTVPERIAASHFTRGSLEVADMQEHDFEVLSELFQDPDVAREWLKRNVGDVERAIEDAGLLTRAVEEPDPETAEVEYDIEVDEDVMAELAQRAADSLDEKFDAMQAGIDGLIAKFDALTRTADERHAAYEQRFVKLEQDDEERVDEIRRDMPRKIRGVVGYRPRMGKNGHDEDAGEDEPDFSVQANEALSRLDTSLYPK